MKSKRLTYSLFVGSNVLKITLIAIVSVAVLHIIWWLDVGQAGLGRSLLTDVASRFGMDNELSLPTWLVSALALITSGWLFVIARHSQRSKSAWYILSGLFLLLAIDETAAFHELVLQGVHVSAGLGVGQTFTSNAWLILSPFIALIGLALIVLLYKKLPKDTFWRLLIAAVVYVFGAFGFEYLGIQTDKSSSYYHLVFVLFEETFEMFGVWLVLRAAILHIKTYKPKLDQQIVAVFQPSKKV